MPPSCSQGTDARFPCCFRRISTCAEHPSRNHHTYVDPSQQWPSSKSEISPISNVSSARAHPRSDDVVRRSGLRVRDLDSIAVAVAAVAAAHRVPQGVQLTSPYPHAFVCATQLIFTINERERKATERLSHGKRAQPGQANDVSILAVGSSLRRSLCFACFRLRPMIARPNAEALCRISSRACALRTRRFTA